MYHVSRKWLAITIASLASIDLVFIVLFATRNILEIPQSFQDQWGISSIVAIMASVHLAYAALIYPLISRRITWIANIISFALFAMVFSVLIDASGNTNIVYRLSYAVFVFLMGLAGPFAPIATITLTWLIMVLSYTGITSGTSASVLFNISINLVVTGAGLGGWLLFRKYYVNSKTEAEVQLTNLLSEEKFKSNVIIESITDGVMIVNKKGIVQLLNKSAASLLGWQQDEASHLDYRTIIKPVVEETSKPTELQSAIEQSIASGKSVQRVTRLETRNQHRLYIDIVASPIFGTVENTPGKPERTVVGTIAVLRDVDSQKREEQRRNDFISTASHEMRTPVASIQGFLELALNPKVTTVDEKTRGYLEKAHKATKHLGQLFQDLLTVSKSDDGRLANKPEIIEIGQFLQDMVEQSQQIAAKKQLQLVLRKKSSAKNKQQDRHVTPLMYAYVDQERLREVIMNLIENAIKYTQKGVVTVGVDLRERNVLIRIADTGIGIAQEDIPHLFQKFYRTDNSATREIGGTGLGLYICRQIVEMMNGRIWVESVLGTGSTFFVELPRISPDAIGKTKLG